MSQHWPGWDSQTGGRIRGGECLLSQPGLWELPAGAAEASQGQSFVQRALQTLVVPANLPELLGFPDWHLSQPYSQELASTAATEDWACTTEDPMETFQNWVCWQKESKTGQPQHPLLTGTEAPSESWLAEGQHFLSSSEALAGHGLVAHTMLGLSSPLSALAMQCREEKGFNPSQAAFPSGVVPLVMEQGWTMPCF